MLLLKIYIITSIFCISQFMCMIVIPERPVVEYTNPKYVKYVKLTSLRTSRKSPYYMNWDGESKIGFGNNVTLSMKLMEYVSGRYLPTPVQLDYKFCDFYKNEPYLGQMYAKQMKEKMGNWSCPLPAGEYHIHNLVLHMENFPFYIPFTWASVTVKARGVVSGHFTDTNELIARGTMDFTIIQKPRMDKKEKNVSANSTH